MIKVHIETYKSVGKNDRGYEMHTVEVSIGEDRRTVSCSSELNGRIFIMGLAVRFRTGDKVWPGTAVYWVQTKEVNNVRPNIDKGGVFQVAGFIEDFKGTSVRSRHNAVA